jgi:hypothetical protein
MLYQPVRAPFWQRHPWTTGAAVVLVCWLLIHGSYTLVAITAAIVLAIYVRRRVRALARRNAGLRARAEYEHRLSLVGDPRGLYGRYPPVQPGWFQDPLSPWLLRYFDGWGWTGHTAPR